jgi:hypothetical protein
MKDHEIGRYRALLPQRIRESKSAIAEAIHVWPETRHELNQSRRKVVWPGSGKIESSQGKLRRNL